MSNNSNNGATIGFEKQLWDAADKLRANSQLSANEYSRPVLGLIFLKYADYKFEIIEKELKDKTIKSGSRKEITKIDYQAKGILFLPDIARFSYLLNLPEKQNMGEAINNAMKEIEKENENLKDVLPKTYNRFENDLLISLLKNFSNIKMKDVKGDLFGRIYEYFLGKFAAGEGKRGGEFFTPISIVRLIVEIMEPYHGFIYDPACGSGGMFVQSAQFIESHKKNPTKEISIYGQERTSETIRICKMNLAVHGLEGDIKQGNTYYEDYHQAIDKMDFVMANPPFNVKGIDKENLKDDKRFKYGLPSGDNGNYIWIQVFLSSLNESGRAGFVMANSASDAGHSELEIRKKLIEEGIVDVMVSIGSNFFYTVTLPCTLWFFDKSKRNNDRKNKILFIDVRHIYNQVDRAHKDFTDNQLEFIANIVRLYRGENIEIDKGSKELMDKHFPDEKFLNVPGLCRIITIDEIKEQNYSLNPGRYVGVKENEEAEDFDFYEKLEGLNEELEQLNTEARELEEEIAVNVEKLLESQGY